MAKTRKQFESGVKDLKEFWESKIDKHMQEVEKKSKPTLVGVVSAIVLQIIALGFANCIIWIAKPSSSKKYIIILPSSCMKCRSYANSPWHCINQ